MTETLVSRASPAIRQIISATVGANWPGMNVVVREVPAGWEYTDMDAVWARHRSPRLVRAWYLNLETLGAAGKVRVWEADRSPIGGPAVVQPAPQAYEALVHLSQVGKRLTPRLEIIVLQDAIDSQAIAVATDALLTGGKKAKEAAVTAAKLCGAATGSLCLAIAEAHAKTLAKGERFGDPSAASVTTAQTPSARRQKKSAKQLEAEIQTILRRRD